MSEHQFPEARDLGQAILLLQVLGQNVQSLTNEIRILRTDMATREELYQVRDALNQRMDALKNEVHDQTTASQLKVWAEVAQHIGVLVGVIGGVVGGLWAVFQYIGKMP
jgi:hypothetical protein